LDPIQVAQSYNFPLFSTPLLGTWNDATGQTIGILEFGGGYDPQDFDAYWTSLNIKNPAQVVSVPPVQALGGTPEQPDPFDFEVALDVEVAGAIAQGAKIVIYFGTGVYSTGPVEMGWYALISKAITDDANNPSVLSISYAYPEPEWPAGAITMISTLFQEAALRGITVFVASGDFGASGYNPNDP
jgi:kumamolisin